MLQYLSMLIIFFFLYGFLGWTGEVIYYSVKNRRFSNQGLLNIPIISSYGFVMVLMILGSDITQEHIIFQILRCFILVSASHMIGGFFAERVVGMPLWDYAGYSFFGGKLRGFVSSGLITAVTYTIIKVVHPFIYLGVALLPHIIAEITALVISILLLLDFLSILRVSRLRRRFRAGGNLEYQMQQEKGRIANLIYRGIWKRLERAYPDLMLTQNTQNSLPSDREAEKEGIVFAKGLCFYKLLWVFLITSLLGDIIETFYVRLRGGVWMRRSGLVFGPFSVVWGIGAVVLTIVLYRLRDREDRWIFMGGFLMGGVYEYTSSLVMEALFHTRFWDYSSMPFNIGGRTNVMYMFFWGVLALIWIKLCYPVMSREIEGFPPIAGIVITWAILVVLVFDIVLTAGVTARYSDRKKHPKPDNFIEQYLDDNWPDSVIKKMWPNLVDV